MVVLGAAVAAGAHIPSAQSLVARQFGLAAEGGSGGNNSSSSSKNNKKRGGGRSAAAAAAPEEKKKKAGKEQDVVAMDSNTAAGSSEAPGGAAVLRGNLTGIDAGVAALFDATVGRPLLRLDAAKNRLGDEGLCDFLAAETGGAAQGLGLGGGADAAAAAKKKRKRGGGGAPQKNGPVASQLTFVGLAHNEISSISRSGLSAAASLLTLNLSNNHIVDASGLFELAQVQRDRLEGLGKAPSTVLRVLVLAEQAEPGLASLDGLGLFADSLDTLVLSRNPRLGPVIAGQSATAAGGGGEPTGPLAPLRKVSKLSLSECGLRSMPPLHHMRDLRDLRLSGNRLLSLPQELAMNTQLKFVDAGSNQIRALTDVAVLSKLPALQQVTLRGNPLESACGDSYMNDVLAMLPTVWYVDGTETETGKANRLNKAALTKVRENRHKTKVIVTKKWQARVAAAEAAQLNGGEKGDEADAGGLEEAQGQDVAASRLAEAPRQKERERRLREDKRGESAAAQVTPGDRLSKRQERKQRRAEERKNRAEGEVDEEPATKRRRKEFSVTPNSSAFDAVSRDSLASRKSAADTEMADDATPLSLPSRTRNKDEAKQRKRSGVVGIKESKPGNAKNAEKRRAAALAAMMGGDDDSEIGGGGSSAW